MKKYRRALVFLVALLFFVFMGVVTHSIIHVHTNGESECSNPDKPKQSDRADTIIETVALEEVTLGVDGMT